MIFGFGKKGKGGKAQVEIAGDITPKRARGLFSRKPKAQFDSPRAKLPKALFKKAAKRDKDDMVQALKTKKVSASPIYGRLLSFGSRFILLIGDEGTILIHMKGNTVLSRQFVPDASDGNLLQLRETIAKDKQAPITMIIDSVDQSFIQQTLPPVSPLFVQKLIKRRLDRDFKPDDIKGAIMLGREKVGRKDWNFLMVSVEKSPQLVLWLDFVMSFENRFRGIVLLSVEAGIFVKNLERALGISAKAGSGAEWKILVSHNKVGGFRQIILRNGTLIFTRLALPVGAPTPEIIAGNIEQEMLSTIEYLKRFGYNARNGLDVYIIASEDVCKAIDPKRFDTQSFHAFSPHTMAQYLGIKGATQPTDQFGDVVLAAAVGIIRKNILKLTTTESRLFDKFQLYKHTQRMVGTFLVLALIIQLAYSSYNTLLVHNDAEDAEQKQKMSEQTLQSVKGLIADSKIDVDMVANQISLYNRIRGEAKSPRPFLNLLSKAIKPPVTLKSLKWRLGDGFETNKMVPMFVTFNLPKSGTSPAPANAMPAGAPVKPMTGDIMTAVIALDFPAGLKSPALFKKYSEDFLTEMHNVMPDYALAFTSVPAEYLERKNLQMNFDQGTSANTLGQLPVAVEISIRGAVNPKKAEAQNADAPKPAGAAQ